MAIQTWYAYPDTADTTGAGGGSLTSTVRATGTTDATGWVTSRTAASNGSTLIAGTTAANNTFAAVSATAPPSASNPPTGSSLLAVQGALQSGTYAAGSFVYTGILISSAASGAGQLRARLWAYEPTAGTYRELTSGNVTIGTTYTGSTGGTNSSTVTITFASAVTLTNEVLCLQLGYGITTAGGTNNMTVKFRSGSKLVTPSFTVAAPTKITASAAASGTATASVTGPVIRTIVKTTTASASGTGTATASPTILTKKVTPAWPNGYAYRRTVTLDHTKVSGGADLANFPALVNLTDTTLRSVANGGHVRSAAGYDIRFELADGTKLDHELDTWNAATGTLFAWVRVPTLSATADTTLYLYYGNASVAATEENVHGVWQPAGYVVVGHFGDGVTYSPKNSASGGVFTMNNGGTPPPAVPGEISGGFSKSTTPNNYPLSDAYANTAQKTYTAWAKYPTSAPTGNLAIAVSNIDGLDIHAVGVGQDYLDFTSFWTGGEWRSAAGSITRGAPVHVAISYDDGSLAAPTILVNGVALTLTQVVAPVLFGGAHNATDSVVLAQGSFDFFDEARRANAVLSPGWLATEYANQSAPSTFAVVAGEVSGMVAPGAFSGVASATATPTIVPSTSPIITTSAHASGTGTATITGATIVGGGGGTQLPQPQPTATVYGGQGATIIPGTAALQTEANKWSPIFVYGTNTTTVTTDSFEAVQSAAAADIPLYHRIKAGVSGAFWGTPNLDTTHSEIITRMVVRPAGMRSWRWQVSNSGNSPSAPALVVDSTGTRYAFLNSVGTGGYVQTFFNFDLVSGTWYDVVIRTWQNADGTVSSEVYADPYNVNAPGTTLWVPTITTPSAAGTLGALGTLMFGFQSPRDGTDYVDVAIVDMIPARASGGTLRPATDAGRQVTGTTVTKTVTVGAVQRATRTRSVTIGAVTRRTMTATVSAGATAKVVGRTRSTTVDATAHVTGRIKTLTAGAVTRRATTMGVTVGAVQKRTSTRSVTVGALVSAPHVKSITAGATAKVAGKTRTVSVGAVSKQTKTVVTTAGAVTRRTAVLLTTAGATTTVTGRTASVTAGSVVRGTRTVAVTVGAVLFRTQTRTATVGATVRAPATKSVTVGAVTRTTHTLTSTVGAVTKRATTRSVTAGAMVSAPHVKQLTVGALLRAVGNTRVVLVNATIKRTMVSGTLTVDAALYATAAHVVTVGAVVKRPGALNPLSVTAGATLASTQRRTLSVDAAATHGARRVVTVDAVTRATTARVISVDAVLHTTRTVSVTIGALLAVPHTATVAVGATIKQASRTRTVTVGAFALSTGHVRTVVVGATATATRSMPVTAGAVLQRSGTRSVQIDGALVRRTSRSLTVGATLQHAAQRTVTVGATITRHGTTTTVTAGAVVTRTRSMTVGVTGLLARTQSTTLHVGATVRAVPAVWVGADALLAAQGITRQVTVGAHVVLPGAAIHLTITAFGIPRAETPWTCRATVRPELALAAPTVLAPVIALAPATPVQRITLSGVGVTWPARLRPVVD